MRHAARRATRRVLIATAASVAILSAPTISLAQTRSSQAPPAPAANAPGAVEEIVVTAQLREQSLQEVPISAIVLSGRAVATQNLNNLETLTQSMPSVHVGLTPTAADIYIRGTGSGANPSFDQAAGTFIDGIYYGRSRISSATFFDLDHIELLKGPQSTFFGNNAIAGAFNIGTKAPGDTLSADARILYGSYGDRVAEAAVSGPITDDLAPTAGCAMRPRPTRPRQGTFRPRTTSAHA
jgi:iron complex outermembrane receptor protein